VNAMQESLNVFDEVINSKYFTSEKTSFILFLNKNDLFIHRLKDKIPLSVCFGEEYKGKNYSDKTEDEFESEEAKNEWFENCYKESVAFIESEYKKRNRNKQINNMFVHITTATNKDNIQKVFKAVTLSLVQRNMLKQDLL